MTDTVRQVASCDPVWERTRDEAQDFARQEPILASFYHATVLNHQRLEDALSFHLAQKLGCTEASPMSVREVFDEAFSDDAAIGEAIRADMVAVLERDPACFSFVQVLLYFKGFHALQSYRVAHWLWRNNRRPMALFLQSRISEKFAVDIHPAARVGRGIMMDHATGIVIGETAVVEDDVSMLHEVTLGGTGKETTERHPKIRRGVLIGAGAKILGDIEVGESARVASSSVVLEPVPAHCTVAGVPAKIVGCKTSDRPSR
ncbi:MAG: serine O-acetyltransferase, partial [Alphaproteobacteria bacterium]